MCVPWGLRLIGISRPVLCLRVNLSLSSTSASKCNFVITQLISVFLNLALDWGSLWLCLQMPRFDVFYFKGRDKTQVHSYNGTSFKAREKHWSSLWHAAAQIHSESLSWKSLGKCKMTFRGLFGATVRREVLERPPLHRWAGRSCGSEAGWRPLGNRPLIASS